MKNPLIRRLPDLVIALVFASVVVVNFHFHFWTNPKRVLEYDILSYYAYLPATFIHEDPAFGFVERDPEAWMDRYWLNRTPIGKSAILTSMGLSFMYCPFFTPAHFSAWLLGYQTDGFSAPYKFALIFGCLFYLVFGLYFLKKILLRYFNPTITALTLLAIVFGTNLFYYATIEAALSHAYSFSLICIFTYLVIRWHEQPDYKLSFFSGLLAGLISLIRPTNILVLLLLFFWDVTSWKGIPVKIRFFLRSYRFVLVMILSFLLVWAPQLIYWKFISGSFFFYSYGPNGGNFYFTNPQVINQLFSYRKGWLLYTPLMAVALLGIVVLYKKNRPKFLPILIFTIFFIYVLSSWWSWWYGGSFGLRAYVDAYGVFAIPLAAIIAQTFRKHLITKIVTLLFLAGFIGLNLFQTYQYEKGIIHFDSMTKDVYWACFGKTRQPADYYLMLEKPDYDKARQGIYVIQPKDPYVKITDENCVEEMMKRILKSEEQTRLVRDKAKDRGITFDEMLRLDAEWVCAERKKAD